MAKGFFLWPFVFCLIYVLVKTINKKQNLDPGLSRPYSFFRNIFNKGVMAQKKDRIF